MGQYTSSSEVVWDALPLTEKVEQQQAEKLNVLRRVWQEGVENRKVGNIDFAALQKEARARRPVSTT